MDKRASGRHFGFSRADLSSPTRVRHHLSNPNSCLVPDVLNVSVGLSPPPGSHGSSQRGSSSGSRGVRTAGRSDWPFPGVCGGRRCVLVPPIALPPGGTQRPPAGAPGAEQPGEDGWESRQPSSGQSGASAVQQRDGHQDGNDGGRLKPSRL